MVWFQGLTNVIIRCVAKRTAPLCDTHTYTHGRENVRHIMKTETTKNNEPTTETAKNNETTKKTVCVIEPPANEWGTLTYQYGKQTLNVVAVEHTETTYYVVASDIVAAITDDGKRNINAGAFSPKYGIKVLERAATTRKVCKVQSGKTGAGVAGDICAHLNGLTVKEQRAIFAAKDERAYYEENAAKIKAEAIAAKMGITLDELRAALL